MDTLRALMPIKAWLKEKALPPTNKAIRSLERWQDVERHH